MDVAGIVVVVFGIVVNVVGVEPGGEDTASDWAVEVEVEAVEVEGAVLTIIGGGIVIVIGGASGLKDVEEIALIIVIVGVAWVGSFTKTRGQD